VPPGDRAPAWRAHAGLAAAVALAVTVIVLESGSRFHPEDLPLLAGVPLLVAPVCRARLTADVACLTAVVAILLGVREEQRTDVWPLPRLAVIAVACAAAVAVAVGRRVLEERLRRAVAVAQTAQQAILRPLPPEVAGIPVAARYLAAAEAADIGGDMYAALDTRFGVRMFVGDVCGSGLPAVRLASTVLGSFREAAYREETLNALAGAMNDSVIRDSCAEEFATAVLVEVPPSGPISVVRCGHAPPLRWRTGHVDELDGPGGLPLGIAPDVTYTQARHTVLPGDRVLLFTDGVAEGRRQDVFFDLPAAATVAFGGRGLGFALDRIVAGLRDWVGGPLDDDAALLAFCMPDRQGGPAAA